MPAALSQLAAPPVFVVGAHRSGTTWVFDMLTTHPEVAGVFESGLFAADLGVAPLFHPGHWYDEATHANDREFFGRSFRLPQLVTREQLTRDVRELTSRWLASALEPGTRFLVEKTPQHATVISILAEVFPGAAVVNVIRDGRDVAVSALEAQRSWLGPGRVREASVTAIARRWADVVRRTRQGAAEADVRFVEIRFEDLHADPSSIAGVFQRCGIPTSPEVIESIVAQNAFEAFDVSGDDAFRRGGRVGDWRNSLGFRERLEFERAAGNMLRELEYESRRTWWVGRPSGR